jgi:transcriptional antiterminator RfaH
MPILPSEPFVFPEDLLTAPVQPTDGESRWWVLHTRPRAEKALARKALGQRLPYFLPLYERHWRNGGRSFRSNLPLFPGYVFLFGDVETRLRALETNLVANCLPVPDQERFQQDMHRVYRLMSSGAPISPEARLEPGMRVGIISGPLAGLEGTFLRRGPRQKFYVEVQFLQAGVSAEVEDWMIQALDSPRHTAVAG